MEYFFAAPVALACSLAAYCTLNEELADRIRILHIMGMSSDRGKNLGARQMLALSLAVGLLCYGAALMLFLHIGEALNRVKMLTALICMAGAACNDYREKRIPNIFPFTMAAVGLGCLAAGCLTEQQGAMSYVVSSLFATVLITGGMAVASLLTRQGIGMGDIKLLGALALIGGAYTVGSTLFYGVLSCSLMAIVLLLAKKKTINESLPFGPFIFIGYLASVFCSLY